MCAIRRDVIPLREIREERVVYAQKAIDVLNQARRIRLEILKQVDPDLIAAEEFIVTLKMSEIHPLVSIIPWMAPPLLPALVFGMNRLKEARQRFNLQICSIETEI